MEFKIISEGIKKELLFREGSRGDYKVIQLGNVEIPSSSPEEHFEWVTRKLKEHGLVPADTVFNLNR